MNVQEATQKVEDMLSRGIELLVDPDNHFKKKLIGKMTGEHTDEVLIKFGVDPTRPDIHLGHAVILKALRAFQDMGCKVVFLIGDFTARIGDPTGKSVVRPELDQAEIEKNMHTYLEQVGKILRMDPDVFSWMRNSDWFINPTDINATGFEPKINDKAIDPHSLIGKTLVYEATRMQVTHLKRKAVESVSFSNVLWTLRHITHARLIERDMFQDRITSGESLYMHEMLYPVMQGIDSVILHKIYGSCDMEVGGNDQTFNILMGRDVMRISSLPEQAVLIFPLLPGTDGAQKMSKSSDNYITITEDAPNMYGKIMSIPDSVMKMYFLLLTYSPRDEIEKLLTDSESGRINPRDVKMRLAREIVAIYHGDKKAQEAEAGFVHTFAQKGVPQDMHEVLVGTHELIGNILLKEGFVDSKTEWRRLVDNGAITNLETQQKITDTNETATTDMVLKIGKYRFIKIKVS